MSSQKCGGCGDVAGGEGQSPPPSWEWDDFYKDWLCEDCKKLRKIIAQVRAGMGSRRAVSVREVREFRRRWAGEVGPIEMGHGRCCDG